MPRRPPATVKSRLKQSGEREWVPRCLLHAEPQYVGLFGSVVPWFMAGAGTREAAQALLQVHQRTNHKCAGCLGLRCPRCKGTSIDLTYRPRL